MVQAVFTITPAVGSGWLVRQGIAGEADFFADRRRALEYAQALALGARPALVRVLDASGSVEDEWLFGPLRGVRRVGPLAPRSAVG